MSLTSMLKGKTQNDIDFQNILKNLITPRPSFITISGKKAFSNEYEELVPYSLKKPSNSSIIGMSFDYLARFIVAKTLNDPNKKISSLTNLAAERGLKKLERFPDKRLYNVLSKKYDKGIKMCTNFINNKKSNFDDLIYFSSYLASLETIARSGRLPSDIKSLVDSNTDIEIINDLRLLCNVFENKFINSGIVKEDSSVIFNPTFGFTSMHCGGADADIFIDGTLYDFKCTKDKGYKWVECAQIIGYYLLHIIDIRCGGHGIGINEYGDEYNIVNLAFYKSRYGEIETIDVNSLDENKVEQSIKELAELWNLDLIE